MDAPKAEAPSCQTIPGIGIDTSKLKPIPIPKWESDLELHIRNPHCYSQMEIEFECEFGKANKRGEEDKTKQQIIHN